MRPIYELIRKENGKLVSFKWMLARQKVFEDIKAKLAMVSIVTYSNFDQLFILYMNTSGRGIGAVLH